MRIQQTSGSRSVRFRFFRQLQRRYCLLYIGEEIFHSVQTKQGPEKASRIPFQFLIF